MLNNIKIRQLNNNDIDDILNLYEYTISRLKDPTILRNSSKELLLQSISNENIAYGIFIEKELIAIGIAVDPKPPEVDLRINLQKYKIDKAMDLKVIIVKENYRGNGLQKILIVLLEKQAKQKGYTHFCVSISPNNLYSSNNFIELGYQKDHTEIIYDGLLRDIYVKQL